MNHWGSDQGITVLKQLGQLYTFLVWETIVLDTVSHSETSSGNETKVACEDLEMLRVSSSAYQDDPQGKKVIILFIPLYCFSHTFACFFFVTLEGLSNQREITPVYMYCKCDSLVHSCITLPYDFAAVTAVFLHQLFIIM